MLNHLILESLDSDHQNILIKSSLIHNQMEECLLILLNLLIILLQNHIQNQYSQFHLFQFLPDLISRYLMYLDY